MATYFLKDSQYRLGAYNLTSDLRQLALNIKVDEVEDTVFGDSTRSRMAGLMDAEASYEGLWSGGTGLVDEVSFSRIGLNDELVTICPENGLLGAIAYFMRAAKTEYSPAAGVGEAFAFTSRAVPSNSPVVRGTLMENGAKTTTGNGTGRQLVTVSASQFLYAGLHITAVSGGSPSITVIVESDDNGGFSSPTTRFTFNAATAIGHQWATPVAGPITDNFWRVRWTISGTTPSFTIFISIGIQ